VVDTVHVTVGFAYVMWDIMALFVTVQTNYHVLPPSEEHNARSMVFVTVIKHVVVIWGGQVKTVQLLPIVIKQLVKLVKMIIQVLMVRIIHNPIVLGVLI